MKIFKALGSGFRRSAGTWKGILITWFVLFVMVALIALPEKSVLKGALGQSMITERLAAGFDIEVFTDLGPAFSAIIRSFSTGLMLLTLVGIIVNAFLTGGLFNSMKSNGRKFSSGEFFEASARNFVPFLIVTFVTFLIISLLASVLVGIPLSQMIDPGPGNEKTQAMVRLIMISLFVVLYIFLMLVADYARTRIVTGDKKSAFRALGYGFAKAFGKCVSSWPMMLILWFVQLMFIFLVLRVVGHMKPKTGFGVFGLFLLSQVLFIIRIFIKTWRYGSVISLSEMHSEKPTVISPEESQPISDSL